MKLKLSVLALSLLALLPAPSNAAPIAFIHDTFLPWGSGSYVTEMNAVFGVAGWDNRTYATTPAATLFTPGTKFVYMEGGDFNAVAFNNYLVANRPLIEAWVAAGGCLLMNAAPNQGGDINMGFGGVNLNFAPPYIHASGNAQVTSAAILGGGITADYTGNFFSHATVSGGGITSMITAPSLGGALILGEKDFGAGHVIFGGMTATIFHQPNGNAVTLQENILRYGADCTQAQAVPEPATLALAAIGSVMVGLGWMRRRKAVAA